MRNFGLRFIALTCLFLAASSHLSADRGGYRVGSLYVGASGGYSTILGKTSDMSVPGLGTGGIELGFDGYWRHFIYNFGINCHLFSSTCSTDITVPDATNDECTVHYEMLSPLNERQMWGNVGIRTTFGYSANRFLKRDAGGIYALAGFDLAILFGSENRVDLAYRATTTSGNITDIKEYNSRSYVTLGHSFDMMLCGEVGYELNLWNFNRLRVGAFVEYGLVNSIHTKNPVSTQPNPDNLNDLVLNSYYSSPAMHDIRTNSMMAGVRVSLLFCILRSSAF